LNYELQIINFKVQTSKFKEYSIACNALAGANIKAKEVIWSYKLVAQSAIMSYELFNYELQIINFKVQTSKFKEYKYNISVPLKWDEFKY